MVRILIGILVTLLASLFGACGAIRASVDPSLAPAANANSAPAGVARAESDPLVDLRATLLVIAKQEGGLSGDDDIVITATANSAVRGSLGTRLVYAREDVPQWQVIAHQPMWLGTVPEGDVVDVDVRIDELDTDMSAIFRTLGSAGTVAAGAAVGVPIATSAPSALQFDVCSLVGGCSNLPDLIGIMKLRLRRVSGAVQIEVVPVANARDCVYHHSPIRASFNWCYIGEGATYGIIGGVSLR